MRHLPKLDACQVPRSGFREVSYLTADERTARLGGWHPGKGLGVIAMKGFRKAHGRLTLELHVFEIYFVAGIRISKISSCGHGNDRPTNRVRNEISLISRAGVVTQENLRHADFPLPIAGIISGLPIKRPVKT